MRVRVVSNPENHNSMRKTAKKNESYFNRKKKNFLIADNKLQVDQIKRKIERQVSITHYLQEGNWINH